MADRYWVGGTASWDGTAGTKWATTSGGAGGASVPTASDDVFFTNLSTGTCTIATGRTAKSLNCTGFTGTITGTGAITVGGSVTLVAGMTYTHTGTVTISGTGTLTTAGKAFSTLTLNSSANVTLGDALNTGTRNITVTQGTFNTANYSVTAGSLLSSNANVRTITLGSSTVTLRVLDFAMSTNLTFNANTSQIDAVFFGGGSKTFHNVTLRSTENSRVITGANTFNNLTLATAINLANLQCSIDSNQTVNGTFACGGVSVYERNFVRSDVPGTPRTITAAVISSAADCDFRDITIAGAAAPISPTRAGDCGGNSGITFPAPKTVYRVGTNTNWISVGAWSLTSGVTGNANDHPLPQDTAIINNTTTGTSLSINNQVNAPTLDLSGRTTAYTLTFVSPRNIYNSFTLGSGVTVAGTAAQTFAGRGTMVFTSAGKTITFPCIVDAIGTFRLGDAYNSTNTITHTRGTFDANNYNLTATRFTSSVSNTRTITMGSGLWTLSSAAILIALAPWGINATNLTFNKGTAEILLSNNTTTTRDFVGGGLSYNKLTIGGTSSTSTTRINGINSFTELASTKTVAHTVQFETNQGTIDTWSIAGANAGARVIVNSSAAGTRRTFSLTNQTQNIDFLNVRDIGVNQLNRFFVGTGSVNEFGNNRNVYFSKTGQHAGFLPIFL